MSWKDRAQPVSNAPSWKDKYKGAPDPQAQILNERAPEISAADRAIAKNFSQSTEKQVEYLKQKYPGLNIQVMGNDVLVGDGKVMRKLDPSTLELEDISDIGNDVVAGVTSTLGGIGGGMAGALAGGAGALPGALAGTAAAGAGTEALRQRIGKALGIPQEVSAGDAALEGGLNAAGTLAFGTGKIPGVQNEFKGAIRGAWNAATPKLAQYWTGVTDDVLSAYVNPTTRERINQLVKGGKTEFTDDLVQRIRGGLASEKKAVGSALQESIDSAGGTVNISPVRQAYRKHIGQLQDEYQKFPNAINKAKVDAAEADFNALFKNQRVNEKVSKEITTGGELKAFKPIEDQLEVKNISEGVALDSSNPYRMRKIDNPVMTIKGVEEVRAPITTEVKQMTRLEAFPGMSQVVPDEVAPSTAFRIQQDMKEFGDLKRIGSGLNPRYATNATQAERDLADLGLSGYQQIGKELDRVTEGASPQLKAQYADLKDLQKSLAPSLNTDQSAYSTFTNLDGKSKVAFKEALEKLGEKTGENYREPVTMLQAADYFGSNSWVPKSIGGTTATSRTVPASVIGGLLGGKIGAGFGMPGIGAVTGVAAGNATASPQMLKKVVENTDWMRYLADQAGKVADAPGVTPAVREIIMRSPWLGME